MRGSCTPGKPGATSTSTRTKATSAVYMGCTSGASRSEEDFGFYAEPYVRTGMVQKVLGL